MAEVTPLPTLWEIPDDLWARIEALLDEFDPPKATGRKRKDPRALLNGIICRFRTGCQWEHIPREYGDDSTIHRALQRWVGLRLFELLWRWLVEECDELALVDWEWQAADGWLGKARSGGDAVGPNPTDRAKNGTKKKVCSLTRRVALYPSSSRPPMLMITSCWKRRLRRSCWNAHNRPRKSRKICVSTKPTIMRRVARLSNSMVTKTTHGASAKRNLMHKVRRNIRRAAT